MKFIRNPRIQVLGTLALLSAVAFAALDTFNLRATLKEGDVRRYKLTGELEFAGQKAGLTASVREEIIKVETNGNYTVKSEQLETRITFAGQELPPQDAPATQSTYDANGRTVASQGIEGMETGRFETLGLFFRPDEPKKIGDSWTHDVKADAAKGIVAATATFKLVGQEKVGEWDTLRVESTVQETGSDPAKAQSTHWLRTSDMAVVRSITRMTNAPFPGAPVPGNGVIELNLVP